MRLSSATIARGATTGTLLFTLMLAVNEVVQAYVFELGVTPLACSEDVA